MIKISRLFLLIWTIGLPIYILVVFFYFHFDMAWLPSDWSYNSKIINVTHWTAPFLYCIGWLYFNIKLADRISKTMELMAGTSRAISTHYIIFYGINAIFLLFTFILPILTPIIGVISFASLIFTLLTSRVSWEELDKKTRTFVIVIAIIGALPVLLCSILVVPDLISLAITFFQSTWVKTVDPLYGLIRAYGAAIPIGNFIFLYMSVVQSQDKTGHPPSRVGIYIMEILITAFLYFLELNKVEFVRFLYYFGMFFYLLLFIANFKLGKSREGKLRNNPLGILLNAAFWISSFIFGQNILPSEWEWLKLGLVILSAFIFFVSFLFVFFGHPDLEASET